VYNFLKSSSPTKTPSLLKGTVSPPAFAMLPLPRHWCSCSHAAKGRASYSAAIALSWDVFFSYIKEVSWSIRLLLNKCSSSGQERAANERYSGNVCIPFTGSSFLD